LAEKPQVTDEIRCHYEAENINTQSRTTAPWV